MLDRYTWRKGYPSHKLATAILELFKKHDLIKDVHKAKVEPYTQNRRDITYGYPRIVTETKFSITLDRTAPPFDEEKYRKFLDELGIKL
jgi:hypothetical protein